MSGMASQLDLTVRQPLLPLGSDFRVGFYDEAKLDRYRDAVLAVLERTGVRFGSEKALAVLEEHGAQVDRASGVVRFPPDLVTRALASAPRTFWLGSRDGTLDLDLASGETYNPTNGCGTEVIDWRTGVLPEAPHRVDRDVEDIGDVELRLHRPGMLGVGEVLHLDAAEAEVAADVVHRHRVAEVEHRAAELVGDVLFGLRKTHAPGHLHAGHQISGGPHPAHARGECVRRGHPEGIPDPHLQPVDLADVDKCA